MLLDYHAHERFRLNFEGSAEFACTALYLQLPYDYSLIYDRLRQVSKQVCTLLRLCRVPNYSR